MSENKEFLIQEETLKDIANNIRDIDPTLKEMSPKDMANEIKRLTAIIEQDFDANSLNAQSGKAVAEAVNLEKERAMAAEATETQNRDMADNKLQSQINNIISKQETQQDKVITRTLTENTVTETFDAPEGEQILILQDENKTGSIKFDKTTGNVTIKSNEGNIDFADNDIQNVKSISDGNNKINLQTSTGNIVITSDHNVVLKGKYGVSVLSKNIKDVATPLNDNDATNKSYVDAADTTNANAIAQNEENIVNETTERKAEDAKLQEQITENRGDIKNNKNNLDTETQNRVSADENLQEQITANKNTLDRLFKIVEDSTHYDYGTDTSDATANADDIIMGKTAYARGEKLVGTYVPSAGDYDEIVLSGGTSSR